MLSERARQIGMSATLRVSGLAHKLRAEGVDVLDFSVGEPDLPTPDHIKEAGKRAIEANRTRYTSNEGIVELRRTIADKLRGDNGLTYEPEAILVSSGAKASLYFAAMALFGDNDEVVIPSPYWVSFPEQVRLAGATPVIVRTEASRRFKLEPAQLREVMTPRTRGIILNYPSNPTGACYERAELERLAEVCIERDIVVIADEIYEKLVYDGRKFTSVAALGPEMQARTVVVNGVSKSYCMTGWRIGYAAGPRETIAAMGRIQSHGTSHPSSISQWAALEALRSGREDVDRMVAEFERRRDVMVAGIGRLPGFRLQPPEGAFYVFPDVTELLGRTANGRVIGTVQELAVYLLERARVAVVPGDAFGAPGHVRISYAASEVDLRRGLERIAEALAAIDRE